MRIERPHVLDAVLAFLVFATGTYLVYLGVSSKPPRHDQLTTVRGTVSQVVHLRNEVQFRVADDARAYIYSDIGGGFIAIERALRSARGKTITIKVDAAEPRRLLLSDGPEFRVWEIQIGEQPLRSYDDIAAAWRQNNQMNLFLGGPALLLGGIFLLVRRYRRSPP
jgi:hypothetical protein